jgi:ElaB/YqjD/DUF883 family membrane-anchored ribosome-binding protein
MADDTETERIHEQMAAQRAALGDKLASLEHKIVDTMQAANDAVRETVRDAKGSVEATVQSVRDSVSASVATVHDTLDVTAQVDRHPWGMFAASIAVGFIAGCLFARPPQRAFRGGRLGAEGLALPVSANEPATTQKVAWADNLAQTFGPEIQQLKGLAIGAFAGFVRDKVNASLPDALHAQVAEMVDNVATKLGGAHEAFVAEHA